MEFKSFQELQEIIPPLSNNDYERLKEDIKKEGIQIPIQVLSDGIVIDGFHRWKIAKELGIKDIPYIEKIVNKEEALDLGITLNLNRRHLSYEQKKEIIEKLEKLGLKRKNIAKIMNVSKGTITKIARSYKQFPKETTYIPDLRYKIPKEIEEKIVNEVEIKNQSQVASDYGISQPRVSQIVTKVKARERKPEPIKEIIQPEDIKYKTIVIDPPWPIQKIERNERPKQGKYLDYPIMSIEEIKNIPIGKWADSDGCHVYLWTTHKFLPIAFEVFKEWNIKYQCLLTWVKNVGFTPFSWMYSTEHILFGHMGSLPLLKKGIRLDFKAKVREHSRKPDEFYGVVRRVSPEPRLDVFAREEHKGFELYGNEVNHFEKNI